MARVDVCVGTQSRVGGTRLADDGGEATALELRRRAALALARLAEIALRQGRHEEAAALIGRAYLAGDGQLDRLTQ